MGKPVTVDSDDVEILLLASAGARKIEDILQSLRQDPAMIRVEAKGQIAAAHDRINRARADAIRHPDDRGPEWGKPPEGDEIEQLRKIYKDRDGYLIVGDPRRYAGLRSKGLVVMGNVNHLIKWGDGSSHSTHDPSLRVKLTASGEKWCRENLQ